MNNQSSVLINDFALKKAYTDLIENRLFSYLWDFFLKPMFKIMRTKPIAENEENILLEAIKSGEIIYEGNGFKAEKKFSNRISKELIKIGAKYNKYTKTYEINKDLLPKQILNYLIKKQEKAKIKLEELNAFLQDIQNNIDTYIDLMVFNTEVKTILDDAGNEIKQNIKHINVIEPELTEEQYQQIEQAYTKNMQYYVKNWTVGRIEEMREKVHKAILEGFREEQVIKMLKTEYGIAERKARFLAHNETSIMLAEYKKATYTAMGFTHFIWKTRLDGRERLEHKELNGTIWEFDNPPTVVTKEGRVTKGLPGAIDYNCRCTLIPIRPSSAFVTDEFERSENLKRVRKYVQK